MFDHHASFERHINDLSTLHLLACHCTQIVLTVGAHLHSMDDDFIRCFFQRQGRPLVACLASGFLPAWLAQTLGLSHKAIRRGGQMTVVAILLQPFLQRLHLFGERSQLLLHLDDQLLSLRQLLLQQLLFLSQLDQFFFSCHAATLSPLGHFDKLSRTPE